MHGVSITDYLQTHPYITNPPLTIAMAALSCFGARALSLLLCAYGVCVPSSVTTI